MSFDTSLPPYIASDPYATFPIRPVEKMPGSRDGAGDLAPEKVEMMLNGLLDGAKAE